MYGTFLVLFENNVNHWSLFWRIVVLRALAAFRTVVWQWTPMRLYLYLSITLWKHANRPRVLPMWPEQLFDEKHQGPKSHDTVFLIYGELQDEAKKHGGFSKQTNVPMKGGGGQILKQGIQLIETFLKTVPGYRYRTGWGFEFSEICNHRKVFNKLVQIFVGKVR